MVLLLEGKIDVRASLFGVALVQFLFDGGTERFDFLLRLGFLEVVGVDYEVLDWLYSIVDQSWLRTRSGLFVLVVFEIRSFFLFFSWSFLSQVLRITEVVDTLFTLSAFTSLISCLI